MRDCFARAASPAVFTSFSSSGGGSTAGNPRKSIHNSRLQPMEWYRCSSSSSSTFSQASLRALPFRTLEFFGRLTEKLPILMVLGFGRDDAFRRDELSGLEIIHLEGHFHRLHQRLTLMPDDPASRSVLGRVEPHRFNQPAHDLFMVARLLQVLLPFLFQVSIDCASDGSLS